MGAVINNTAYESTSRIKTGEVDMCGRMKLSALMLRHQEIGEKHLKVFGTESQKMRQEQNLAFIFTKVNIKIHRLPSVDEEVTLTTWCSALKGVRFTRNYVLRDKNKQLLTETKAEVTTIDLETRKIVRASSINGFADFLYNDNLENNADYPKKLSVTKTVDAVFNRPIVDRDIDFNGHVNNTVYADMIFECLGEDGLRNAPTELCINFVNEAMPGEVLEISAAKTDFGYCFKGVSKETVKFTAEIKY